MSFPLAHSFDQKLNAISTNPILLFEDSKGLSSQAINGDISGLTDKQKILLADKIEKFLTDNVSAISSIKDSERNSCMQKLKEKCLNLGLEPQKLKKLNSKIENLIFITDLAASDGKKVFPSIADKMPFSAMSVKSAAPESPEEFYKKAYHGKISHEETIKLLAGKPPGTFLIRESGTNKENKVVALVISNGSVSQSHQKDSPDFYANLAHMFFIPKLTYPLKPVSTAETKGIASANPTPQAILGALSPAAKSIATKQTQPPTKSVETVKMTPEEIVKKVDHGSLSGATAAKLLKNKPMGTYLLRDDEKTPGGKILSVKMDQEEIVDIQFTPHKLGFTFSGVAGPIYISELSAIFKQQMGFSSNLKHPLFAASASPFISPPIAPTSTIEKWQDGIMQKADHGKISKSEAFELLKNKPPGTFLIRDSSTTPGAKVISYNYENKVLETLFNPNPDGGYTYNSLSGIKYFNNLTEVLKDPSFSNILKYPILVEAGAPAASSTLLPPPTPSMGMPPAPPVKKENKRFEEAAAIRKALLEDKQDPNVLLVAAVRKNLPETAAWLLKNGAALSALDSIQKTPDEIEMCQWLEKVVKTTQITSKNIDEFAIGLGLGYKSANLMILQAQAAEMNKKLKAATVKVPPFLPIGDYEMHQYLMKAIPGLQKSWEAFLDSFDSHLKKKFMKTSYDPSKVPLKISPQGQQILKEIYDQITAHFINNPYFTLQIEEWLKKENPDFIIVRSTGKEDSDTNSNAGGNDSIPFIKPDAQAISEAMGRVIASYFGEKSVGQRLLAGDRSLFTEKKPFIPVLLQTMIGENVGGKGSKDEDIPRSGVLFTRQQDKAEGVTFIQTGLGNNEGIVSSRVGVDSYYVGKDKHIHAVVREKTTRFVSIEEGGKYKCEPIKNEDKHLERSQALPNRIIHDIKQVADDVSENYGAAKGTGVKAMDMEYTVKLKDKSTGGPVIYLLQARPLLSSQQGKSTAGKSFIDLKGLEGVPKQSRMNVETLLDGNAYVRKIEKPKDILFADDLTAALKEYTNSDSDKIKAIVIKKTAPATSHEAVVLRPKGVAVIVVRPDEFDRVKQMADKATENKPLLIDPQRGMLVDTRWVVNPQALIKKGLISYPIPLEFSLPHDGFFINLPKKLDKAQHAEMLKAKLELIELRHQDLMKKLLNGQEPLKVKTSKTPEGHTLHELIDELAMTEPKKAKVALATILKLLHEALKKSMLEVDDFRADINQMMFATFEAAEKLAKNEIIPAIEKHEPQSLERLYPIKFLEALIFQEDNANVIGQFSYLRNMSTEVMEQKVVKEAIAAGEKFEGAESFTLLQMLKFGTNSFSPECQQNWKEFTDALMGWGKSAPGIIPEFKQLMQQVTDMKLGPIWLNVVFNKVWKSYAGQPDRVKKVWNDLKAIQQKNAATLGWLTAKTLDLNIAEQQVNEWSKPEFVKKNLASFRKQYLAIFGFDKNAGPESLKAKYDAADSFGRLAVIEYLRRAVTIYDNAVKAMKGSNLYSDEKQYIKDFAEMLEVYFNMMEATLKLIPPADLKNMLYNTTMETYLKGMHEGKTYGFGFQMKNLVSTGFDTLLQQARAGGVLKMAEQTTARQEFAVDSFVIGSKADLNFSSHWPTRLEEYFTAFHQNMEQVAKYLNTKNGLDEKILSGQPQALVASIKNIFKQDISSLAAEGSKLEVKYQIPLRQHSSALNISYDSKAPENGIEITVSMFGNDEHNRWDQSATLGTLLAHNGPVAFAGGIPPKINYAAPDGKRESVSFTLHIPNGYADQEKLVKSLHYMLKILTMHEGLGHPDKFKIEIEKNAGPIDWKTMDERFFSDSFYLNTLLMKDFSQAKDTAMVVKIAKNSLLGMARQGIKDYTLHAYPLDLVALLDQPNYGYIPGNQPGGIKGLKVGAVLHLVKALEDEPNQAKGIIKDLIKDPDMKKNMPDIIQALEMALKQTKPPEVQFQDALKESKLAFAYLIGKKQNNQAMMDNVKNLIKNMIISKKENQKLFELAKDFFNMGLEKEAFNLIFPYVQPQDKDQLTKLQKVKERGIHLTELSKNVELLRQKANAFDKNYQEVLSLSVKGLIGLSQHSNFNESYGNFEGLQGYLGVPKYNYVFENAYNNTSKLRKAAPLYIIKGLESSNFEIRSAAFSAMDQVVEDYIHFGSTSPHANDYKKALWAIFVGLYQSAATDFGKKSSLQTIHLKFKSNPALLWNLVKENEAGGLITTELLKNAISG